MQNKSEVIFENSHYVASAMKDGSLIVQSKRKKFGRRLVGENAPIWIDNIKEAVRNEDTTEASFLCRAMVQS